LRHVIAHFLEEDEDEMADGTAGIGAGRDVEFLMNLTDSYRVKQLPVVVSSRAW